LHPITEAHQKIFRAVLGAVSLKNKIIQAGIGKSKETSRK